MASHVRDSVKQIDGHSWLIGEKLVLHKKQFAQEWLWRDSSDGFYYSITEAPASPPPTIPLRSDGHVRLVYDAEDASAVWSFGDAFLKVKLAQDRMAATREHVTLRWLARRKLSFTIPNLLYHTEEGDRSYLFVSRVPGKVLAEVWRGLSNHEKERCAIQVSQICQELSVWSSDSITGVDGAQLPDSFLDVYHDPHDFRPETLQENCSQLGMGCDSFVFCHCDLGPYNVMVDLDRGGSVGVIDWEIAGFVPREWIRTKFSVSWALDFAWDGVDGDDPALTEWREQVSRQLGEEGFPEVAEAWKRWYEMSVV